MGKKDLTLTDYLSEPARYADLWNAGIFHGRQVIAPEYLKMADTVQTKVSKEVQLQRTRDLAMYYTRHDCTLAILALENQETVNYGMPVHVILKEALAYDRQLKELSRKNRNKPFVDEGEFLYKIRQEDKLCPVFTLVIYWGQNQWSGAKSLHELLDFGTEDQKLMDEFKALVPEYPLHFLDLNNPDILALFQTELKTLFSLYACRNDKKAFRHYLETHEECRHMDEETIFILSVLIGSKNLELYTAKTAKEVLNMSNAVDELIEDGRQEGIALGVTQGISQGLSRGILALIETCKELGISKEDTMTRVSQKFSCSDDESRKYMAMYWK